MQRKQQRTPIGWAQSAQINPRLLRLLGAAGAKGSFRLNVGGVSVSLQRDTKSGAWIYNDGYDESVGKPVHTLSGLMSEILQTGYCRGRG